MEETTATTKRKSKTTTPKTSKAKSATTTKAAASSTASKTTSAKAKVKSNGISTEQRNQMIETAAYFIAESQGFCSNPVDDWLTAESLIDNQLGQSARL